MDLVLNVRFLRNFRHTGGLATCLLHRYPKRTSLCCVELYLGVNKEIAVNKLSTDFHIMFRSESQPKFNYNGLIPPSLHCCHTENLRKFNVYAHIYLHKYNCTWATAVARLQVEVWEVQLSVQIEVLLMDRGIYGARLYVEWPSEHPFFTSRAWHTRKVRVQLTNGSSFIHFCVICTETNLKLHM